MSTFDLPRSLVQKEFQYRIKQLAADPSFQRKLSTMNEEERKKIIHDVEEHGKQALRLFFCAHQIVQKENIHISPTEIHQEVKTPLEAMFSKQADLYNAQENSKEQRELAMSRLMLKKAEDFLIAKARRIPASQETKADIQAEKT